MIQDPLHPGTRRQIHSPAAVLLNIAGLARNIMGGRWPNVRLGLYRK